jgi:hypothetical protein
MPSGAPRARDRVEWRPLVVLVLAVVVAGCAGVVRVHRADSRSVHRELTRNVLTTGELSEPTHNVLHR